MNAFIIVLIIFILYGVCDSVKAKARTNKYIKDNTSNVPEQYNIACNIIETIAEMYREEACTMTMGKYFDNFFKMEIHLDCEGILKDRWIDMKTALSKITPTQKSLQKAKNLELFWICMIAKACGYRLEGNFMKRVYSQKIWESLPEEIDNKFISDWQNKYKNSPKDTNELSNLLNLAILCKHKILYEDQKGSYYTDYNNKEILETISMNLGIPTNAELKQMNRTSESFCNIQELARHYSCFKIREMGYAAHTYMLKIRPTPSPEEKEEVCKACTPYEKWKMQQEQYKNLNKKYPKF